MAVTCSLISVLILELNLSLVTDVAPAVITHYV